MLNLQLTAGQAGDCPQAGYLLAAHLASTCEFVADAAYDSDGLRSWIAAEGALVVIPPNPRRKHLRPDGVC